MKRKRRMKKSRRQFGETSRLIFFFFFSWAAAEGMSKLNNNGNKGARGVDLEHVWDLRILVRWDLRMKRGWT